MPSNIAKVDVAGMGLNATDTIIRLPQFPASDSKIELLSADQRAGGQVASAMVACQKWGLKARYIGKVGDDAAAKFQEDEFARAGVDARLLRAHDCPSQLAFILVDEASGERTILWKRDARLAIRPEELSRDWITQARALLVDGHDTAAAAQAARWAQEQKIPVIADIDNIYPRLKVLLEDVDYLIASQDFPARFTSEPDLLKSLPLLRRELGCRVLGATLGARGALAWDGTNFYYSRGFRIQAVDTTGAGDIFHGAFVLGVLEGWPLDRILEFSCAAAALACTAVGARAGIASLAEIERLMRTAERSAAAFESATLAKAQCDLATNPR